MLLLAFIVFLPVIILSPSKFALSFTAGCLLIMAGFAQLRGWKQQLSHMFSAERLPFSSGKGNSLSLSLPLFGIHSQQPRCQCRMAQQGQRLQVDTYPRIPSNQLTMPSLPPGARSSLARSAAAQLQRKKTPEQRDARQATYKFHLRTSSAMSTNMQWWQRQRGARPHLSSARKGANKEEACPSLSCLTISQPTPQAEVVILSLSMLHKQCGISHDTEFCTCKGARHVSSCFPSPARLQPTWAALQPPSMQHSS